MLRLPMFLVLSLLALSFSMPTRAAADYGTGIRFLYVQPGQTLHNIVRRLYPERKREWLRIRNDIIRLNPHAFPTGDPSSMKAGVKLTLPVKQVIKPSPIAPRQVGTVVATRGRAIAVNDSNVSRKLAVGHSVFLGDKLVTAEDGFLRLRMIDRAQIDIRCLSVMVIEEYELKQTSRTSVLNLLQGSLRKITGEIGKWSDDVYILKTPVASVGVRGTEYALRVYQSDGCDGSVDSEEEALYLKVIKGLVDVTNDAASTAVAKGDTVYIPLPGAKPVDKEIEEGVIVTEDDANNEDDDDSSVWWWILGGLALIALL